MHTSVCKRRAGLPNSYLSLLYFTPIPPNTLSCCVWAEMQILPSSCDSQALVRCYSSLQDDLNSILGLSEMLAKAWLHRQDE